MLPGGALNDTSLISLCGGDSPLVTPFEREFVGPASIDLRLGKEINLLELEDNYHLADVLENGKKEIFKIYPLKHGETILVNLFEKISIPDTMMVLSCQEAA
jgi:deoxycytidine triphosphate deaminase